MLFFFYDRILYIDNESGDAPGLTRVVLDIPKICTIRFLFWAEFKRILFELFCIREIDVYFRKFQITFSKECTHIQKQQTVKYNNVILFKSFKAFV